MATDNLDQLGPLYNEIGVRLWSGRTPGVKQVLLYVEAGHAWYDISVYQEFPDKVEFIEESDTLFDAIQAARESAEAELRWTTMEYIVSDGEFKATLGHGPEPDEEFADTRRESVLRRHFADKPVHYDLSEFE